MKKIYFLCFILFASCTSTSRYPLSLFEISPKYYNFKPNKELFDSVKQRELIGVKNALKKRANPNVADCFGQSALMWACWYERIDIVKELLQNRRLNINAASEQGYTALMCAADKGNIEIFQELVKNKAKINAVDKNNETVLHKTAKSGNENLVKYILTMENGKFKDLLNKKSKNDYTPLHLAVISENYDVVNTLLSEFKADQLPTAMEIPAEDGKTTKKISISPLGSAFRNRYYSIFVSLLKELKGSIENVVVNDIELNKFNLIFTEYNEEIKKYAESSDMWYANSLYARFKGSPEIIDGSFKEKEDNFYEAIKKRLPLNMIIERGRDIVSQMNNKIGPDKENGDISLLTAIDREDWSIVDYLLQNKFRSIPEYDILIFAIEKASASKPKNYTILDNLLRYLNDPSNNRRVYILGKNKNGDNALMLMLQDNDYLLSHQWSDIRNIFTLYDKEGKLGNENINKNEIMYFIINIDTTSYPQLENLKNEMFMFVCDNYLKDNLSTKIDQRPMFIYFLKKNYYFGAEYICKTINDVAKDARNAMDSENISKDDIDFNELQKFPALKKIIDDYFNEKK